ncbi:EcsC family protein, partial [Escherichia coli]|uniref:EcsC family protein n=1 Tax=Escherichia coli TaxID=562 RepID=UPI0011700C90
YIDLAKLLQLVPGIGAFVGAYVNNKLVDKLGEYAMYAYRMRILYNSDEVCVTKNKNWLNKLFRK